MTEIDTIARAQMYLEKLAGGVNPLYVKELRRGVITDWLTEIGLLSDNIVNNKTRKRPTAQGMNIGIITEERTNQYGTPYEGVFYKNLYSVLDYEDVLLPKYSAEILRKYSDYLNHAVVQASGRKAYQEWVRLLKRMRKIEGGRELSRQIAEDWRIRYKNRSAMMDEMKTL